AVVLGDPGTLPEPEVLRVDGVDPAQVGHAVTLRELFDLLVGHLQVRGGGDGERHALGDRPGVIGAHEALLALRVAARCREVLPAQVGVREGLREALEVVLVLLGHLLELLEEGVLDLLLRLDLDFHLALAAVQGAELALVAGLPGVSLADLRRRHEWPPSVLCSHREKWAASERQRTGRLGAEREATSHEGAEPVSPWRPRAACAPSDRAGPAPDASGGHDLATAPRC